MFEKLQKNLSENFPFLDGKKILLATSGGIDSMVMIDLFLKFQYEFAIAHCNFQLRGIESFEDQQFVEEFAQQHDIPVFITQFDTKAFAEDYKLSTQVAARELRYNWFYELLTEEKFDYILTAHHADDNLETFLINLSRGTGLDGLTGIPKHNEKLIRPLLAFGRNEIESYAVTNKITWREDSSNASDDYLRNKIRHNLIPVLKELNANFLTSFEKTQNYLLETQAMAEDASIMIYQQVAQEANDEIHFNLKKLKQLPNYRSYLYAWLKEFGFSDWESVYSLAESQSGKQVFSTGYRLLKNREFLILSPLPEKNEITSFSIKPAQQEVNFPIKLSFSDVSGMMQTSNSVIFVDKEKLKFPLFLRRWNEGDVFQPFGMNGQSKKVGKFFKDEKFAITEKGQMWLLCSNDEIVWIVGSRADERFRVEPTTNQILKITLTQ